MALTLKFAGINNKILFYLQNNYINVYRKIYSGEN